MRGKPFEVGNTMGKGRPPGSRNKKTIFQQALESHGTEIINQVKLQALKPKPDSTALRLCVERLIPVCKAPNSRFPLPVVRTSADLPKALTAVSQAVARGLVSAQQGEGVARIIDTQRRAIETGDFEARIRHLEEAKSEPLKPSKE
jgi:hypothetical protein